MEINITAFVRNEDPSLFSASVAELGQDAGSITWANAKAHTPHMLVTAEQLDALRDYVKGFGAWEVVDIEAWDAEHCNGLFVQMISGELREAELSCDDDTGEIDWDAYRARAEEGAVSGNLYQGTDGEIYFYLGC